MPVLQLLVDQNIGNFGGYSGGAVLNSGGEVTAILIEQLPQRLGTPRPPASNVLFALPVGDVIGRLPIGMPVPPVRPLPVGTDAADGGQPPSGYLLRDCFAGLIDNYAALRADIFPGQTDAADRLEESIRQPADGYLVATAAPGFGKTALVADILNPAAASGGLSLLQAVVRRRPDGIVLPAERTPAADLAAGTA